MTHLKTKRAQLGDLEIFLHQAEYKVGCWSDKLVRTEGKNPWKCSRSHRRDNPWKCSRFKEDDWIVRQDFEENNKYHIELRNIVNIVVSSKKKSIGMPNLEKYFLQ